MTLKPEVSVTPAILSQDGLSADLEIVLLNTGNKPVDIHGIGWTTRAPETKGDECVLLHDFGGQVTVRPNMRFENTIRLAASDGNWSEDSTGWLPVFHSGGTLFCPVRFAATPRVATEVARCRPALGQSQTVTATLQLDTDGFVLSRLELDSPWLKPRTMERKGPRTYLVTLEASGSQSADSGLHCIPARCFCKGRITPLEFMLLADYHLQATPDVEIRGLPSSIIAPTRYLCELLITNPGDSRIEIQNAGISGSTDCKLANTHELSGLSVPPRGTARADLPLLFGEMPPGQVEAVLELTCSLTTNGVLRSEISTEVIDAPISPTPISFDFGTSSSCVAVSDSSRGRVQCVEFPVEVGNHAYESRTILPSRIRFTSDPMSDLSDADIRITDRSDGYTAEHMKLAICNDTPLAVPGNGKHLTLRAEDAIAAYLKCLYDYAKTATGRRYTKLIATVPTKYGKAAVERFRNVLRVVAPEAGDALIQDEAIAACLFFIRKGRRSEYLRGLDLPTHYSLALIDVGGGTTDISLLEVEDREDETGKRILALTVRGVTGRRHFGGVHFNDRYRDQWLRTIDKQAAQVGYRQPSDTRDLDGDEQQMYLRRISGLANAIEKSKKKLSTESPVSMGMPGDTYALVCEDGDPSNGLTWPSEILPPDDWNSMANGQFEELLDEDLKDIAAEVKAMCANLELGSDSLGCVLLVGQSARLTPIRESLGEAFGHDRLIALTDETAKTCVAIGALEFYQLMNNPGDVQFTFEDLRDLTPARLGILWSGKYGAEFREIMPVGTRLPSSATIDIPRGLAQGSVELYWNYGAKDSLEDNENLVHVGRFMTAGAEAVDRGIRLRATVSEDGDCTLAIGELDSDAWTAMQPQSDHNRD